MQHIQRQLHSCVGVQGSGQEIQSHEICGDSTTDPAYTPLSLTIAIGYGLHRGVSKHCYGETIQLRRCKPYLAGVRSMAGPSNQYGQHDPPHLAHHNYTHTTLLNISILK